MKIFADLVVLNSSSSNVIIFHTVAHDIQGV